ncbi:MAG: IMPACT family protein [Chitinophagales bacterium]|jgi:uncharacterized YigZ family protein
MKDTYLTLAGPSIAEFKDRASKFLAYAWPVKSEEEIQQYIEALKKQHFKANHHCFAWRLGQDGHLFRANDDGEPSGTAGRPILGQIDSAQLTDVLIVVVRYFGGTLLGTSGLINAYRESACAAIQSGEIKEVILYDVFTISVEYGMLPELVQGLHKIQAIIQSEEYGDLATIVIAIRKSDSTRKLLELRARIYKVSMEEAETLEWPEGMLIST